MARLLPLLLVAFAMGCTPGQREAVADRVGLAGPLTPPLMQTVWNREVESTAVAVKALDDEGVLTADESHAAKLHARKVKTELTAMQDAAVVGNWAAWYAAFDRFSGPFSQLLLIRYREWEAPR